MISATRFQKCVISGANNLAERREEIDRLNVFPVPDGDTGTNMSMTLSAGAAALAAGVTENTTMEEASRLCAGAMLRDARGNSGVILSLLFQGFAEGCKGKSTLSGKEFAQALLTGVDKAYQAVLKPTEGTILTVSRMAATAGNEAAEKGGGTLEVLIEAYRQGEKTLSKTPDMLPLLKKAGVVDAGGQGYLAILEGILYTLKTGQIMEKKEAEVSFGETVSDPVPLSEEEITFTYCTEFLIKRGGKVAAPGLRAALEPLGDSLIVMECDDLIKVHIHTDRPDHAMELALEAGSLEKIKIENMRLQFRQRQGQPENKEEAAPSPALPEKETALVAVCAGDGLKEAFLDLNCDEVIQGGQTMNPSAQNILQACLACPAKTVFVLPNNSNIIMAARQAATLTDERSIVVIPTKTVPQGIAAALAFDPAVTTEEAQNAMEEAVKNVRSGQVTCAARNSNFEGKNIKKGQVLALQEGKLSSVHSGVADGVRELTRTLTNPDTSFITLFAGLEADPAETERLREELTMDYPQAEVSVIYGGQPVYHYFISAER